MVNISIKYTGMHVAKVPDMFYIGHCMGGPRYINTTEARDIYIYIYYQIGHLVKSINFWHTQRLYLSIFPDTMIRVYVQ